MIGKTVWLYKLDPSEGIDLTIRIAHKESAAETTCMIELDRPGTEKAVFRPGTEKAVFPITKGVVQRIEKSIELLNEIPFPRKPFQDGPTIQHRYEDKESKLVVMWEILPFKNANEPKPQYKIINGTTLHLLLPLIQTHY